MGLARFVFGVAVWQLGPDWGQMAHDVTHPTIPNGEGRPTYLFYAIVMLGAPRTPVSNSHTALTRGIEPNG